MWATRVLESNVLSADYILSGPKGKFVGSPVRTCVHNSLRSARRRLGRNDIFKHSSATEIAHTKPREWENYASLAILRDPIERAVSMLRYARQTRKIPASNRLAEIFVQLQKMDDPNDFILSDSFDSALQQRFFMPQSAYVLDPSGDVMVTHLLYTTNLEKQMRAICEVPERLRGQKLNSSVDDFVLSPAARTRIEQAYLSDFVLIEKAASRWS